MEDFVKNVIEKAGHTRIYNIAVNDEELPETIKQIMDYPGVYKNSINITGMTSDKSNTYLIEFRLDFDATA